jgi:hypothetical protein
MPERTPSARAVFLSCARENAEASHRVTDALKEHGLDARVEGALRSAAVLRFITPL